MSIDIKERLLGGVVIMTAGLLLASTVKFFSDDDTRNIAKPTSQHQITYKPSRNDFINTASIIAPAPENIAIESAEIFKKVEKKFKTPVEISSEVSGLSVEFWENAFMTESSGDPHAISSSGAVGLCQLMPQTNLEYLMKKGGKHGYGAYASHIIVKEKPNGGFHYSVKDQDTIEGQEMAVEIDHLRFDGFYTAAMCGEYMKNKKKYLQSVNLGEPLNSTHAYFSILMGGKGAAQFLKAYSDPDKRDQRACDYISKNTVKGNLRVLFNKNSYLHDENVWKMKDSDVCIAGQNAKSIQYVYDSYKKKMGEDSLPQSWQNKIYLAKNDLI